jgi:DNA-binding MarR family transcriptional regulator
MSNERLDQLVEEVAHAIAKFQQATDLVDDAVAGQMGINRTDLRCLGVLFEAGSMSAGQLAQAVGLSRAATTTAIDRLARQHYARRVHAQLADRRSVLVELTPTALRLFDELYGPIAADGAQQLRSYREEDLLRFRELLRQGYDLQVTHAQRIRTHRGPGAGDAHLGVARPQSADGHKAR